MFFATPLQTNEQALEKVAVAAVALTLFYFCDPSNVLSPIPTKKSIFREVNSLSHGFRELSPPKVKKTKIEKVIISLDV